MAPSTLATLSKYLRKNFPDATLMPSKNGKTPMYVHKHGAYSSDHFDQKGIDECQNGCVILLPKELIVIDIDDEATALEYERMFPIFNKTVKTKTKKGFHYYFRRTEMCNEAEMFDTARSLISQENNTIPVDIKTLCKTGTRGVISIPPSPNKTWVRQLGKCSIAYMPDEFVQHYNTFRKQRPSESNTKKNTKKKPKASPATPTDGATYTLDQLSTIVAHLCDKRASNYGDWFPVVCGIFNACHELTKISDSQRDEVIHMFSKKSPEKYNHDAVQAFISNMQYKPKGITMASLIFMLREDDPNCDILTSPNGVDNFPRAITLAFQTGNITHEKTADIFYQSFPNSFIFADGILYERSKYNILSALSEIEGRAYITGKMKTAVSAKIKQFFDLSINDFNQQIEYFEEKNMPKNIELYHEKIKAYNDAMKHISNNLENKNFIDKAFETVKEYGKYLRMGVKDKMDNYPYLIAFNNGVYDLQQMTFRLPKEDEYMSITCGYDFEVKPFEAIQVFLNSIMKDEPTAHYLMKELASLLYGGNTEQLAHFWVGSGGNSKGTLDKILRATLGAYYGVVNVGLYSSYEKDANRASPEKAALKGLRVAMCSETDGESKFVTANLNSLTGGDPIKARFLHSQNQTFEAFFKPIIQTNNLPKFTDVTDALFRRNRVINFPFSFKYPEDMDPNNPFHRPRDDLLVEKLFANGGKLQLMNLMIHYYPIYKAEGLVPSEYIANITNEYKNDLDSMKKALLETIEYSSGALVGTSEIFNAIKANEDFAEEFKFVTSNKVTKYINKNGYTVEKRWYNGKNQYVIMNYKLKTNDCVIQDDDDPIG
jgi:P4 family phage/plasmid primase-like protien